MTLGRSPSGGQSPRSSADFCHEQLSPTSIYELLHRDGVRLFPDEEFADLFCEIGRWSVPPRILATVMVLQRLEGLSDREAVDRFWFDLRWKYAAGGLDFDYPGFVHTVLVGLRARLRRSARPHRIFERTLAVAREAGLIGRKRVLDSTALYDAVATQDTVTLIRSAIRGVLRTCDELLAAAVRGCLRRDDDYATAGKPACDWDDKAAREGLVDALARDAYAVLALLDGRQLAPTVSEAAALLATVVGQDLEQRTDGVFRVAHRVAKDRVISTVDPEARHGHKTAARSFDGYQGHVAIDPDSEIVTATAVTPGNVADGVMAAALLGDVLGEVQAHTPPPVDAAPSADDALPPAAALLSDAPPPADAPTPADALPPADAETPCDASSPTLATVPAGAGAATSAATPAAFEVYGDASYGTAGVVELLEAAHVEANVKVQGPSAPAGCFGKDAFEVDLEQQTVKCPAGVLVQIRRSADGGGFATFGVGCHSCALRTRCTDAKDGRTIRIHPHEATLQRARTQQSSSSWKARYRATRPKVERTLAHLMRRRHGGRRARVRGCLRIGQDFSLLVAAHNLRRLARRGVHFDRGWRR